MKFLLEVDVYNYQSIYWFKRTMEQALEKELTKKRHGYDFRSLSMRHLSDEEDLSVEFVRGVAKLISKELQEHKDIDHL